MSDIIIKQIKQIDQLKGRHMKICIYGAGSIGCYIGGRLAAAGAEVSFVTRPRIYDELSKYGLKMTDYAGNTVEIPASKLRLSLDQKAVLDSDIILVCVKSSATEQVAKELQQTLVQARPDINNTPDIISFQNGLGNVPILKQYLPDYSILEGMVPFNIAAQGSGHFHQGTSGAIHVKSFSKQQDLTQLFKKAQLDIFFDQNMLAIQWAKILLNLNNSINALSKLPLKAQLSNHQYRRCLAMAQQETLDLLDLAQIKPAKLTAISAHLLPKILSLPNFIFKILSRKMLKIDPVARSSMQDDLIAGRSTEVDWINGEVVKLADQLNTQAPINALLIKLIKQAEVSGSEFSIGANELKDKLEYALTLKN
jgi:2-dehydropantoate 2-reductase